MFGACSNSQWWQFNILSWGRLFMGTHPDAATARYAAIGMRFRGSYLVQQAGYTLGLAALAGTPLAGKLPPNFLERTAAVRDEVDKAMQDKAVRNAEARQATGTQNQLQRQGKIWVRGVGRRCQSGMQLGAPLSPDLGKLSSPATVPGLLEQMNRTLSLLAKHAPDMDAVGMPVQTNIDEGRKIVEALQKADSEQERVRFVDMPAAVLAFCAKKGELYTLLKVINNAGHECFAENPAESGKFNMSILHRHGQPSAAPEPTPPAPAPTPTP
jgi:hypothetical protein